VAAVSLWYRLLYRLGITPWERDEVPARVREIGAEFAQPGRVLDVGCGTGRDAVYLAQRGWSVTGVDAVPRALAAARERAAAAGVQVEWVQGDVTRLEELGLDGGYQLVLDRGCFHGLPDDGREACAHGVNMLAAADATLLMFAFSPGFHGPAPRGIGAEEIKQRLGPGWELVSSTPETDAQFPPWLRNPDPYWHRLERRETG
jgi:SAM-dependent methyltransferase